MANKHPDDYRVGERVQCKIARGVGELHLGHIVLVPHAEESLAQGRAYGVAMDNGHKFWLWPHSIRRTIAQEIINVFRD